MNVAIYNPEQGHRFIGKEFYPGCTPDEVREMALLIQVEAKEKRINLGSALLVAWEDQPTSYFSIFTLGDHPFLDEPLLDGIESLARTKH